MSASSAKGIGNGYSLNKTGNINRAISQGAMGAFNTQNKKRVGPPVKTNFKTHTQYSNAVSSID